MRKLWFLVIACFIGFAGFTQTGSISGKVNDNAQKSIAGATASLFKASDSTLLKTALTDKDGIFNFNGINHGKYVVSITVSGYAKANSGEIILDEVKSSRELGVIRLTEEAKSLQAITISGRKPFIEQKMDKMVVNVDAAVTNAGSNILEVLEKSPGVTIDKDGNISLKGKQQVLVLIDGRQTYLGPTELASLLKSMPASNADQIEIMTNPSAKYDAAGNSGIINIKTKKNKQQGFNGSINLNYSQGVYWRTNDNFNLNYRKGKFNFFANGGYSKWNSFQNLEINRKFSTPASTPGSVKDYNAIFDQDTRMRNNSNNFMMKMGVDYYLSKKTTLGVITTGLYNPEKFGSTSTSYLMDGEYNTDSIVYAVSNNNNKWKNGTLNLNLRHQFDSTGKEISADLDYASYNSSSSMDFINTTYDPNWAPINETQLRGDLPVKIDIYTAKVDYSQNFLKGKLETGVKTSYVSTDNAANYYNIYNFGETVDYSKTNNFIYKENINAVYINYNRQFKKIGIQTGLRYEYTNMEGNQFGNPVRPDSSFKRGYGNFFPTVFISYQASKTHQWGFNIGRRIDRPAYQDLNPFLFFLDQYTYQAGNPFIKPQYTNNVEVSHTFKGFLTTTVNYSHTIDFQTETFEQAKLPNGDDGYATIVRQGNIGSRDAGGIAISAQVPVKKWWTAILYTNVNYSHFKGEVNNEVVDVEATNLTVNINNQFRFEKGWGAELSGWYRSKGVEGQILINPMGQMSAGVTKQILKGKSTIKLNIRDILYTQVVTGNINFQNTEAYFKNARDSRVATLSFVYRFGKPMKDAQPRRKTGGASDEQNRVKLNNNQ